MLLMLPIFSAIQGAKSLVLEDNTFKDASRLIDDSNHELIIGCLDSHCEPTQQYLDALQGAAIEGKTVIQFTDQFPGKLCQ